MSFRIVVIILQHQKIFFSRRCGPPCDAHFMLFYVDTEIQQGKAASKGKRILLPLSVRHFHTL